MKASGLSLVMWVVFVFSAINVIWLLASTAGSSFGTAVRTHLAGLIVTVAGCVTFGGLLSVDTPRTLNLTLAGALFVAFVLAFVLDIRRARRGAGQ
ncbi:hypothetical protein [Longispora urticae]